MVRLRLFANLRELAGTASAEVAGATVEEVLRNAVRAYGPEFARGVERSQVWLNGEPVDPGQPVGESDEVALIPPVSGGATAVRSAVVLELALVLLLAAGVAVANLLSPEALAVVLVAVAGLWAWDVVSEGHRTGYPISRWMPLAAAVAGGTIPYVWGLAGLGIVLAAVVLLALGWAVFRAEARRLEALGPGFLVSLVAATAPGSLVLVRLGPEGLERVWALLAVVLVAGTAGWLSERLAIPYLDPLTAASLGAVLAATVSGWLWTPPGPITMLLVGVALAVALIAGRVGGSLLRTAEVYLVETLPGGLTSLDGPMLAASVYASVLALLT